MKGQHESNERKSHNIMPSLGLNIQEEVPLKRVEEQHCKPYVMQKL